MTRNAKKDSNVRFWTHNWVHPNSPPVKITLKPGQSLSHGYGAGTDEGWNYHSETWTHDGDYIRLDTFSDGVDCDGRLSTGGTYYCMIGEDLTGLTFEDMASYVGGVPVWTEEDSFQRDYSAEAAGY
jgi:hypothetical protein